MELHVLGCHGPFPCAGGATSGYLLTAADKPPLLLDCGAGILGKLLTVCDPSSLGAVLLTHLHYDHVSDMGVLQYYPLTKAMPVYYPLEDDSFRTTVLQNPFFDIHPYPNGAFELPGGWRVETCPTVHPVPCRALRITDGEKTLVYTGDTNLCPALTEFCRGADLLLCDAAFLTSEWAAHRPHLSAALAAQLAVDSGVTNLYLTHLPVRHDPATLVAEARAVLPSAQAVAPGLTISF